MVQRERRDRFAMWHLVWLAHNPRIVLVISIYFIIRDRLLSIVHGSFASPEVLQMHHHHKYLVPYMSKRKNAALFLSGRHRERWNCQSTDWLCLSVIGNIIFRYFISLGTREHSKMRANLLDIKMKFRRMGDHGLS
jgi:hypothetical protein